MKKVVGESLKDTSELMKLSEQSIEAGSASTHKIESIFGEFKGQSQSLERTFSEFSVSMNQQKQSIEKIRGSMYELNKLTDINQEKSVRILGIAGDLSQTAQTMENLSQKLSERKVS